MRDSTKTGKINLEQVFRHAFLYLDKEHSEFIGWNTNKKAPFLVPKDVIMEQREGRDSMNLELHEIDDRLREIGWPPELIEKWMKYDAA